LCFLVEKLIDCTVIDIGWLVFIVQDMHADMEQIAGSVQQVCNAGNVVQSTTSTDGQDLIQQQIK